MSPRVPRGSRLRAVPDPEDEPQVVRAPPEPAGGERGSQGEERQAARRSVRAPAEGGSVRAPAEGGAVRAPPDGVPKRPSAGQQRPSREAEVREHVVELNDPDAEDGARGRVAAEPDGAVRPGSVSEPGAAEDDAPQGAEHGRSPHAISLDLDIEPEPSEEPEASARAVSLERTDEEASGGGEAAASAEPAAPAGATVGHGELAGAHDEDAASAAARGKERVQVGGETHEFPEGARTWAGVTPPSRRGSSSRFLTDVIVDMGLVAREAMDQAIEAARNAASTPERVLVDAGTLSQDGLARGLAQRYGLDHIDVSIFPVDPAAVSLVSSQAAKRYQAVPVAYVDQRTLLVAMADPANVLAVDDIAIMTGCEVRVAVASPQDVGDLIARMDRLDSVVAEPDEAEAEEQEAGEVVNLRDNADDAPVVKLVNQIVAQAVEQGASDVHLAPTDRDLRVRFRVDGVLRDVATVPRKMAAGVISRVKIMAELDISERRLPQDGRVGLTVDGRHVDLRIVTLPSSKGESVTMRILDKGSVVMDLGKLGMGDEDRERFEHAFHLSHGCVLVTGPTGSGKTTTLYAALTKLNSTERNIITVEDPVEYQMDGLTQVQVAPKVGLTFAVGLRTMVRADPDVIMVGEIRDRETAQIAVESALTGHLVLSTLHTNDAPSAIHRLIEMDIEPFLVASAIECVEAQRLARTLCPHCKRRAIVPVDALRASGYNAQVDIEAYEPVGCPRCGGSGYRGRIAIYEVMQLTREIRDLALERRSADEIREVAIRQGMRRMRDDGLEKVRSGLTSMAEVTRVIGSGS